MRARSSRHEAGRRPRRGAVFSLAALAVLVACGWILPSVLVLTDLRDRPLQAAFAGIAGTVSSRSASWGWIDGMEYRDVVLADTTGRPVVVVPRMMIDRGLFGLLGDPRNLGTIRLLGADALIAVRPGGSTIEDVLAPWLAALSAPKDASSFEVEVIDGAVEFVDLARNDSWRATDVALAAHVVAGVVSPGWALSGRLLHAGEPQRDGAIVRTPRDEGGGYRFDRTTIAAAATAALAKDGGWTVSASAPLPTMPDRTIAVAGTRLPLGISSVWSTRFGTGYLADGLADVRLDFATPLPDDAGRFERDGTEPGRNPWKLAGSVAVHQFALCDAVTLAEILVVDHCEAPLDLACDGDSILIRTLKASSSLFKAEGSGRVGLPRGDAWQWADALLAADFALAADVDLAAAARATPGGLRVRDDTRVTAGQLQVSAAAHGDGSDRVLELRASARDLAAVQGERQLRWNEPFSAWLRGRRSPQADLLIEEARISSSAVEVAASGNAEAIAVQWTIDLDKLFAATAEVLDLAGTRIAGTARGRVEVESIPDADGSRARLSASLAQFACERPGLPPWRDEEIVLEAEGTGIVAAHTAVVDACHAVLRAGEDRLEFTQTGAAIVSGAAFLAGGRRPPEAVIIRPAPHGEDVSADVTIAGDLGRWQPRLAAVIGNPILNGWTLGGATKASAALAIRPDGWQVTRAGVEIERFAARRGGRQIVEPRLVATGAGMFDPARGALSVSSAEVLTATVSLRTGGLDVRPGEPAPDAFERIRGKVQWQADVGRLEKWLLDREDADRWPAAGRTWGTLEIIDTPTGANLLLDATASDLTLSRGAGAAVTASAGPVWAEPRAHLVVEVTRPPFSSGVDRLVIERVVFDSKTCALAAAGSMEDPSTRRLVTLAGTATYDWDLVTRLLVPWTGGRVRLAGAGPRPVMVRAPLEALVQAVMADGEPGESARDSRGRANDKQPREVTLPEDWLSSMGGRDGKADHDRIAPVRLPVKATGSWSGDWLRSLAVETSAAWAAADIDGFRVDPGQMDVRLFEGQLAFGPFDLAASGGRLRGAPWIKLLPFPGELVVPPGRVIDRISLSSRFCDDWISWATPLVGRATRTQGVVSVDVAGARIPFADPFAGEVTGQLIFEHTEVTPGGPMGPLATLIAKLQALIDPRFAVGDKVVLMRVRPEPVRLRLVERKLWHEGLVLETGQLVVRSGGNVDAGGALSMNVEVSFRGDLTGATPVVGRLFRTPVVIPLKGTVQRPQFDSHVIERIAGQIVENTAEALLKDGLGRGLEELFGNPQPAP